MSRPPRFFLASPLGSRGEYVLDDNESRHAVQVLRLREGDAASVFDGRGAHAAGVVVKADGKRVRLRLEAPEREPAPTPRLGLAVAIPKGGRWQNLVEKATELGADRLIPILAERSVSRGEGDPARWRRWSIEAAKQCLRSRLPEISRPLPLAELLEREGGRGYPLFLADSGGEAPMRLRKRLIGAADLLFLVGPEGGFTSAEAESLRQAGAAAVRLSPFVLRIETAALAALAAAWSLQG
ncbi:MAG: 16S rRNA (uracil(1498)-N(3))-methyltransferase [Planctomycetota bacterium]|jgi:16S rRNA (uracil1498-N3)-methyltransferase|nr:16S rRNA (uracil(1498)-N(3))-methyltransferase [Planctomycetota bacterium]